MKYKRKPIWLFQDGEKKVIVKGAISITNNSLYNKMIGDLEDIGGYVQTSRELCPGYVKERTERYGDGVEIYENHPYETREYYRAHWETRYVNPRGAVYALFKKFEMNDCFEFSDLMYLFKCYDIPATEENLLKGYSDAIKMINQTAGQPFEPESFKQKLNRMWPNFGFYVSECLKCIEIVAEKSYDIDELNALARRCKELEFEVPKEIGQIFYYEDMAKMNTKILSLAKTAHQMIYDKK